MLHAVCLYTSDLLTLLLAISHVLCPIAGTTGSQHAAFNKHRETNVRVASPQRSRTDRLVSPSRTQHKQQRRLHADYGPRADTHASVAKRRGLDRRCGRNEPAPTTATRAKYSQRQLGSPARRDAVARVNTCCVSSSNSQLESSAHHSIAASDLYC